MQSTQLSILDSLNQAFRLIKPTRKDLNTFKVNFKVLLEHIDEKETEENIKIHLMDFLKNTYYSPEYLVATKGRTDFVIHTDKTAKSPVGILFEVKKPSNTTEMVSPTNLNVKSMHELVLYYLRERVLNNNIAITNLIITNVFEWYIFNSEDFEKIFAKNSQLVKTFKEWESGQKVSTKTELFYKEIIKPFIDDLDVNLKYTKFDLRDFSSYLLNNDDSDDDKLIPLLKVISPINLLKLSFINDSNTLDKGFYSELLHIIGLEETKDGGKKIITRVTKDKRNYGSLIENTINILDVEGAINKIGNVSFYGENKEEQLFNLSMELCITWVNRILFLKLLEAQLLRYHKSDKKYKFLNKETIKDYDELYKLFFQVLAREYKTRSEQIQLKYSHIPYLNSSLFEISDLEDKTIKINGLDDNIELPLFNNSVLKQKSQNKDLKNLNTLHYFFEFLDAYDFSSVGKEEIQEENKTIINASVLGLVFEKINGYKDGSIYTPGAITMYLCKETITRAVVKKFNEKYNWNCETIGDLKNYISERKNQKDILEFNKVLEDVKIIDPAVGSGHFLVSSLNEIISIKAELGILADKNGTKLSDIDVNIVNDELIITYKENKKFYDYSVSSEINKNSIHPEIQVIQESLFNEKRKIIEGSLFGVDINPNSVKICQLRLWIELLKNAYYKQEEGFIYLETLPNIDINIKVGNSLLSKYSLQEDLSEVFKKQKFGVQDYQIAVAAYKEAPNKEAKEKLKEFINKIKLEFKESVRKRDPRVKKLSELRGQLSLAQNNFDLFGQKRTEKEMQSDVEKLSNAIEKIETEINESESNVIYKNSFEWRFEFPEVLNNKGEFNGFEVVIGNPPYIQLQKMGKESDILNNGQYSTYVKTGDIYCLFYELAIKLLKKEYYSGLITSNKWMRAGYGENTRKFLAENSNPITLIDFAGQKIFEAATVDVNILIFSKSKNMQNTQACIVKENVLNNLSDFVRLNSSDNKFIIIEPWTILDETEISIKQKVEIIGTPLKNWNIKIYRGVLTGYNEAFIIDNQTKDQIINEDPKSAEIIRPILRGRDIKRYGYEFNDLWLINTHNGIKEKSIKPINVNDYPAIKTHLDKYYSILEKRSDKGDSPYNLRNCAYIEDFYKQKIMYPNMTKFLPFYLDNNGFFQNDKSFMITGKHIHFLTAFLNSSIFKYCFIDSFPELQGGTREIRKIFLEKIPVIQVTDEINSEFELLVNKIQENILNNETTDKLEINIDNMIFDLYNLNEKERQEIGFIKIH